MHRLFLKPIRIPSSAGLVYGLKKETLKLFLANGKQGPAARTNNKQGNVDQIQADNVIKRSRDSQKPERNSKYFC